MKRKILLHKSITFDKWIGFVLLLCRMIIWPDLLNL